MEGLCKNWVFFVIVLMALTPYCVCSKPKAINLKFYQHEGNGVVVAGNNGNLTTPGYGTIYVFDDPVTMERSITSTSLGRAKGIVAVDALDGYSADYILTFHLQTANYNGTIQVHGSDQGTLASGATMSVVGGTGDFSLSMGIANMTTVQFNLTGDTIVLWDLTLYRLVDLDTNE